MTSQKTWGGIRICSYLAIVFCIVWAVFEVFSFLGLLTGKGGVDNAVDWSQKTIIKVALLVMDMFSVMITIGLCLKAALNFLKGIREEVVFPKSNVKIFFWLALAYFAHRLCWSLHPIYYQKQLSYMVGHSNVVIPFCILFFAFMYKVAADAVEENNLTI